MSRSSTLWLPYAQMQTAPEPLAVERTEGVRIYLRDGRTLIDGVASWWTACHGYNHPALRAAVAAQLDRMPHVMLGGLVHAPALELAERLASILPGDLGHVFLSESGSVAVEVAMKIAVQFWLNQGQRGRTRFVAFRHGYHGDTWAAMSVSDPEDSMHKLFAGALLEQLIVDLPRSSSELAQFERMIRSRRQELAAVIIEPLVQAAGGMKFHSPEILRSIADIAQRQGLLLIADEIAVGFARTGTLFASEQAEIVPDVMTLSKALTGGVLPLAATVATQRVFEAFLGPRLEQALMHGPTFSGNALACAAANASLALFAREPRCAQALHIEQQLVAGLESCRALAGVLDVRVKGAIGVVELEQGVDIDELRTRFVAAGVWVRPFGNVVYLMPPLVVGEDDLETLMRAVRDTLREYLRR